MLVIGAGEVGTAVVQALHEEHDVTVVDIDPERLMALADRYDVLTVEGNGASRSVARRAGVQEADLVIASTDRDEVNIVAALQARSFCTGQVIVRTQSAEYLEAWRAGQFDIDFMVSSEVETAQAVARFIGMPTALQTDVFAGGRVEMVEFQIDGDAPNGVAGRTIAEAGVPDESVVASIIRGDRVIIPGGPDRIERGDRLVLIASPAAAREWSQRLNRRSVGEIREVVVAGGGRTGRSVAALLAQRDLTVRLVERNAQRARLCAEELPDVSVFHADATDPEFMGREVRRADVILSCTDDDANDLLIGLLAKKLGVPLAIVIVNNPDYIPIFQSVGIDFALNQRLVTAEEIVRFAHDPRTQAVTMVENDRAEVLELAISPRSAMLGRPFRERPLKGAIVGAIIRQDDVIFPRGDDALQAGDRAILFADSRRVKELERIL